jgi:hypothetical protein
MVVYHRRFMVWTGLALFLLKLGARRQIGFELDSPVSLENLNRLSGCRQEGIPHPDTLDHFLGHVDPAELGRLRRKMVHRLIRMKALDDARLMGHFLIVLDGTGHGKASVAVDAEPLRGLEGCGLPNRTVGWSNAQISVPRQLHGAPADTFGQVAFMKRLHAPSDPPEQPLPVARPGLLAEQLDVAPSELLGSHLRQGSDLSVDVHVRLVASRPLTVGATEPCVGRGLKGFSGRFQGICRGRAEAKQAAGQDGDEAGALLLG